MHAFGWIWFYWFTWALDPLSNTLWPWLLISTLASCLLADDDDAVAVKLSNDGVQLCNWIWGQFVEMIQFASMIGRTAIDSSLFASSISGQNALNFYIGHIAWVWLIGAIQVDASVLHQTIEFIASQGVKAFPFGQCLPWTINQTIGCKVFPKFNRIN